MRPVARGADRPRVWCSEGGKGEGDRVGRDKEIKGGRDKSILPFWPCQQEINRMDTPLDNAEFGLDNYPCNGRLCM